MRRLYLQVYAAVVGVLVLFALLGMLAWRLLPHGHEEANLLDELAVLAGELLPAEGAGEGGRADLQRLLERIGPRSATDITVHAADGAVLARVGDALPHPQPSWHESHWVRRRGGPPVLALRLPDRRWLLLRHDRPHKLRLGWSAAFAVLALAVGIGAYPLVRRLTRRLERLQQRVDALGAGDLSVRVEVEGRDEVAELARSFNRAAAHIQQLVGSQRRLLANASHELRSPLARLRMAVELLGTESRPDLRARIEHDIAELDELIGELLLASRLEAQPDLRHRDAVDLLALAAEETARADVVLHGDSVIVSGDVRLLRRMLRNLLDNAQRYGGGSGIEVSVSKSPDGNAALDVCDRGPGVAPEERERIFEPFYRPAGARESDGGVGIGLSLVRQIARHHGGDVECRPRDGGGSCFTVRLPGN